VPSQVAEKFKSIVPLLKQSMSDYKAVCSRGRSSTDFSSILTSISNPPPYTYRFQVSTDGGLNSPPFYESDTPPEEAKKLMEVAGGIGVVGKVASSMALNSAAGGMAVSQSAAAMKAAAAVAFWCFVAVVVLAAIAHVQAIQAKNREAKEIYEAEMYKFNNTRRDDWLATRYSELCSSKLTQLDELVKGLDDLEVGGERRALRLAKAETLEAAVNDMDKEIESTRLAFCRSDMFAYNKAKECAAKGEDTKGRKCLVIGSKVSMVNGACAIDLSGDSYTLASEDAKTKGYKLPANSFDLSMAKVMIVMGKKYDGLLDQLNSTYWQKIDEMQNEAFSKLTETLILAKKLKGSGVLGDVISVELKANRDFLDLRQSFSGLVTKSIQAALKDGNYGQVRPELESWKLSFAEFHKRFRLTSEAQNLMSASRQLTTILAKKVGT
jgi:hypothetical protein